jgi:hypothetical protein
MSYTILHENIVPDGWDATVQFDDGSILTLHNPAGVPGDPAGWIAETAQTVLDEQAAALAAQQDSN